MKGGINVKKAIIMIAVIVAVGCIVFFAGGTLSDDDIAKEYETGTFAEGLTVNDVSIGGMTMAEAKKALEPVEKKFTDETVLSMNMGEESYMLEGNDFDITFDTDQVLKDLMVLGKGGSMYNRMMYQKEGEKEFHITKTVNGIRDESCLDELIDGVCCEPKNADMSFTPNTKEHFTYKEEQTGISIDKDELKTAVNDAIKSGETSLEVPYETTQPKVTVDSLKKSIVRRSYFETSYASAPYNDSNRVYNIKKCVSIINAKKLTLAPGESVSLNAILGDRTEANGWKLAPGYVSGRSEDQPGGGVCQISSTLYCAALKADLSIVQRQNHSIPVGYIAQGLDATISTGGPDLVLKNNTSGYVYICCGLSGKMSVYFEVYGIPFDGFTKILVNSEKVKTIQPSGDMIYTYTDELSPGVEQVYVKRRIGSEYTAYKKYYNGDKLIKTVKIASSKYPAFSGETRVGR